MSFLSEDTRGVLMASLVPGATCLVGTAGMLYDKGLMKWWESQRKPEWAPQDMRFYMAADMLTMLPLGCAAYLVYKHGGGFDNHDTKLALTLFGATNLGFCLNVPATISRNWCAIAGVACMNGLMITGMTGMFFKVHHVAGWMVAPLAVYCVGLGVPLVLGMAKLNCDCTKKSD